MNTDAFKSSHLKPNHVTPDWLQSPLGDAEDPWVLNTSAPEALGHRDACVGNGYVGMRVNAMGEATGYRPGSASFMSGLWGAPSENPARPNGLVELPHWATLSLSGGDRELRRMEGELTQHTQSLDLRTATVSTRYRQESIDGVMDVSRETWLARGDRHIGVLSVEGTLQSGNPRIFLDEELDCLHIPDISAARTFEYDQDLCLEVTSNLFGHKLAIRSRLVIEGIAAEHIQITTAAGSHVARRRIALTHMAEGTPFRVTKLVALVSSNDEADPMAAAGCFLDTAASDLLALRARHEADWADLWQGRVESSHPRLAQLCNASLYHIYCTLREDLEESHGPCGLFGNGWDGNVFWDTELWTLPAIALFRPGMARSCAAYRYNTLPGARKNAVRWNETGARYGWMSGETGEECCSSPIFQEERHIVSCVAMGQWLYAVASGDTDWLKKEGLSVFRGCAEYWAGKAVVDEADGKYHILGVCGSDEHAGVVDDNATTNWGAAWTLRTAAKLVRDVGETPPSEWETIADGLLIPWDDARDIPLQMR
jgi:trehalose/maltose hydrolase-like predicted phosphorylase